MDRITIGLLILIALMLAGSILTGCAKKRGISGGIATMHPPRAGEAETPAIFYTFTIHIEQRPERGMLQSFFDTVKQGLSIPQSAVLALTSPERVIDQVVGGDRREINFSVAADDPEDLAKTIEAMNTALEQSNIDATTILETYSHESTDDS